MQQEMTLRTLKWCFFFFFFLVSLPCLFTEGWQICQFSRERISENLLLMSLVIPVSCSEVLNVLTPHYNRTVFIISGSRASITPPDEKHSYDILEAFLSFQRSLFTVSCFMPVMWQDCSVSRFCADHETRPLFCLSLVCFLQALTLSCLFTNSIWFLMA